VAYDLSAVTRHRLLSHPLRSLSGQAPGPHHPGRSRESGAALLHHIASITALMESTIGLYMTELIERHGGTWSGAAELERETAEWMRRLSFGEMWTRP
jgi:hypothetical protein